VESARRLIYALFYAPLPIVADLPFVCHSGQKVIGWFPIARLSYLTIELPIRLSERPT
jgi:hypothetical protein